MNQFYKLLTLFSFYLCITLLSQNPEFRVFNTSNSGIPSNDVGCLAIDSYDNKWIDVGHGIASLNAKMTKFEYDELTLNGSPCNISCIAIDNFDKLWIGTMDGLVDDQFEVYNSQYCPECPIKSVNSIAIDKENNVWMGSGWGSWDSEGLVKFDGTDWEVYKTDNSELLSDDISCIEVDENNNKWIGTRDGYLVKFDGVNWEIFDTPDSVNFRICSITIDDKGNKWLATGALGWGDVFGSGVMKLSTDDSTWTVYNTSNSGLTSNAVWNISIDKFGNKWMATSPEGYGEDWKGGGLVKFDGAEWTVYDTSNSGLPDNDVNCIAIDRNGNKWIGTGGGLAVFNEGGIVTDVDNQTVTETIPEDYLLSQNYPNPFNPSTTIKYSIPIQSNVTLKVFDVLGGEVATLVNKEQTQGNYEVEFDGSDLTSGIYFYRIQAGDFVEIKKMILLK